MKKLLIMSLFSVLTLAGNAENRKWDFRNWSSTTVENLKAGSDWSDIEKASSTEPTEKSKNNCFWEVAAAGTGEGVELTANGQPIQELQGLLYTNTTDRSLAIAVNYQEIDAASSFGPYEGASYLWFGSNKKNYFVIPNVKAGAIIKMGVESHKLTDARGVNLYVGHGTSGTQLKSPTGENVSAPKTYTEQEWMVPVDLTDAANEDGTYDIQIYNTNGCHIYYIEVNEDAPEVEGATIAYIYDSTCPGYDLNSDIIRNILENNGRFTDINIEDIDVAGDISAIDRDALLRYNVVVVSSTLTENNAFAETLKSVIAYVPMLNMNPHLYKAWGYGEMTATGVPTMTVAADYRENALFLNSDGVNEYVAEDGTIEMYTDGELKGVMIPEGTYFANDNILATVGQIVTMHMHQPGRNTYLYLPYTADNMNYPGNNLVYDISLNAIQQLNATKADVPQVSLPVFTEDYKQLNTDVTIKCGIKNSQIYYTTDGSTPSTESELYTAPINVTAANTVIKAIAYADGYNASEVAELTVSIYSTSEAPEISVEQAGEGKAIVTITSKEEGATIYYNTAASKEVSASSVYTEPLVIQEYTNITAFAGEVAGKKQSEIVTKTVFVDNKEVRIDVVSHFNANKTDWAPANASLPYYYTEGKKNGYNFYNTHEETVKASDGVTDSTAIVIDGPAEKLTVWNPGNGWEMKTYGQGALLEKNTISGDIDDTNTTKRYRAETAFDTGASDFDILFGNVCKSDGVNNDPYSCSIQSTEAFQGPFDIVTFIGNGSGNNHPRADVYVSTDTLSEANWIKVDTVTVSKTQRYIKKSRLSYEGTDKVYVKLQADFSSVMVFDVIVMNHGEKSQEVSTGIKDVTTGKEADGTVVRTMVYSINGTQLDKAAKGINIIKEIYANGAVKTRKVMVK